MQSLAPAAPCGKGGLLQSTETIVKIPLRKPPAGARNVIIKDGRHVGVVVQSVNVGLQPAFEKDDPAVPSIGVGVEFAEDGASKR